YIPAFALALGLGSVSAGLVTSVPLLVGALLQTLAPLGVRRLGSHRRWVVACVSLQASCYVPLAAAAMVGHASAAALFGIAGVYWGGSLASGPAWSAWVGGLVPARLRASYWSDRSRWCHLAVLAGIVASGALLRQERSDHGASLGVFAALFATAALCRVAS